MWLHRITTTVGQPLFRAYWRLRIVGALDSVPETGPLIVISNHCSFLDPWFIMLQFPRPVRFMVNREWYLKSWFWTTFFDG